MFNPKIYERAREIVAQSDVTALVDRVYRQITAEAELNRLQKRNTTTGAVDVATPRAYCRNHENYHDVKLGCPACPPRN